MIGPVIVHKSNTRFQTESFLAGSRATPDGIWAMMYNQQHAIAAKLISLKAKLLRKEAQQMRLVGKPSNPADAKEWEADNMVLESELYGLRLEVTACEDELAHIREIMDRVEPQCRYSALPLLERLEASQMEEWREELKRRVENFLICAGSIPPDEFDTMRKHPEFLTHIVPHIQKVAAALPRIHGPKLALPEARIALTQLLSTPAIEDRSHG